MPNWTLHPGDCLDVLKTLPDNSVDAVVTDPPYGLSNHDAVDVADALRCWLDGKPYTPKGKGFMGRQWDAFVPGPEVWRECLRVLKPGGHLLVFAGTRTQDLMGIAVRLAGFDARDSLIVHGMLHWTHGSGFPKNLDVSKAIDKVNGDGGRLRKFTAWMRTTGLKARQIDAVLKRAGKISPTSTFAVHYFNDGQLAIPTKEMWEVVRPLCGDVPAWVDELVERIEADREVVGKKRSSLGGTVAAGERDEAFIAQHRDLEFDVTAPATDAAKQWDGWGTALKPSQEPILVFRKPLIGNVADNVLAHGTGALNIDGCRTLLMKSEDPRQLTERSGGRRGFQDQYVGGQVKEGLPPGWDCSKGRWPTNTLLCHTPDCRQTGTRKVKAPVINRFTDGMKPFGDGAGHPYETVGGGEEEIPVWECADGCPVKALDAQSGERPGCKTPSSALGSESIFRPHQGGYQKQGPIYPDTGGASRFFPQFTYGEGDNPFLYMAKASPRERSEGLTTVNNHPTVKPISLMRWLTRLVTPPSGTVLDPFNGSGTTGCAAVLEGFHYVGIEREPEYVEIARARIAHHLRASQGGVASPWTERPVVKLDEPETTTLTLDDLFGF